MSAESGGRVQIAGYSLYRGCSGAVESKTELENETNYTVMLDVGGRVIVSEECIAPLKVDPLKTS